MDTMDPMWFMIPNKTGQVLGWCSPWDLMRFLGGSKADKNLAKVQQVLSGVAIVASVPRSLTSGRNLRSFEVFSSCPVILRILQLLI